MSGRELPDLPPIEIVEGELVEGPTAASLGIELPNDPESAVSLLLAELAAARGEADNYLDDLRRVVADFDNFRKRAHREQSSIVERASERVLKAMLPVLDGFDAALAIETQTETEEKLLAGMRSTHALLLDTLAKEGLEVIPTWYEPFDPDLHEAVTAPAEGAGRLMVTEELRRGYRLKGKVLRAALVAVGHE